MSDRCRAFAVLAASVVFSLPAIAEDPPVVAAAADLKFAMEEIAQTFTAKTGKSVRVAFGSSGNFRRQIAEVAPFEMYMSADEEFVFALAKEGYTMDEGTLYAIGRIVEKMGVRLDGQALEGRGFDHFAV